MARCATVGWVLLSSVAVAFAAGCGGGNVGTVGVGAVGDAGDAGVAEDGGGSLDAGEAGKVGEVAVARVCPPSAPQSERDLCSIMGSCEYGSDPNPRCNQDFACLGGTFYLQAPGDKKTCPTKPAKMSTSCPGSIAATRGTSCTSVGDVCTFPTGACSCGTALGPPVQNDAGTEQWACAERMAGCPSTRPRLGSACDDKDQGLSCDYGACTFPNGMAVTCTKGMWIQKPSECPN